MIYLVWLPTVVNLIQSLHCLLIKFQNYVCANIEYNASWHFRGKFLMYVNEVKTARMKNKANVDKIFSKQQVYDSDWYYKPFPKKNLVEKYAYIISLVFWRSRRCGRNYTFLSSATGRTYVYSFGPFWQQGFFFFANGDVTLYS